MVEPHAKYSDTVRIAGDPPSPGSGVASMPAATDLVFLVSEETAPADDLGNLWRHHLVPGFVPVSDTL